MFLIDAKYNCLGEAVSLLEKVADVARDCLGASFEGHGSLEVDRLILTIGYRPAVTIDIALARPPAGGVPFGHDPVHPIGCKESVLDSLPQAIGINRIAEVPVSIAIVCAAVLPSCRAGNRAGNSSGSRASCFGPWRCRDDIRRR